MIIHQIVNNPYKSNTFIIENSSEGVIVIDPGDFDSSGLKEWLFQNQKNVHSVILTHEHLDHSGGINSLFERCKFELIASGDCIRNIANSKRNFSFYYDFVPTYEVNVPSRIVDDLEEVEINEVWFRFLLTPGHSPGSICIITGDSVFTGDTILNGIKSPLKLPGSNKLAYSHSMDKLSLHLRPGMTIYPGHGEPFLWR